MKVGKYRAQSFTSLIRCLNGTYFLEKIALLWHWYIGNAQNATFYLQNLCLCLDGDLPSMK